MEEITVALVGVGGYGGTYSTALLEKLTDRARLIAGVDPSIERSAESSVESKGALAPSILAVKAAGIPMYASLDELYLKHRPELTILSSPIQHHCEQTEQALAAGSHLLCEKPLAATPQQGLKMKTARDAAGKVVAVGYQWSFSPAIQALKRDILAGALGRPLRMRTLVLWPRDARYYSRNRWAGQEFDGQGRPVFDSPVQNACAHYLHNMLYLLGDRPDRSALPLTVTAELYRANEIESYDTAVIRCAMKGDTELHFVTSHASHAHSGPLIEYEFERATISYADKPGEAIVARFGKGEVRSYGSPSSHIDTAKLTATFEAVRVGPGVACGIEAALPHAQVVAAARESSEITTFPAALVRTAGTGETSRKVVEGLDDILNRCHSTGRMPSELAVPWAVAGRDVAVSPI